MWILVSGPYSAPTTDEREQNLRRMNQVAARVYALGHTPVIGCNLALPVVAESGADDPYELTMDLSLALAERCDAVLRLGSSPGVEREVEILRAAGKPVYDSIEEIPTGNPPA